jgi:RNA polymerase sigma factor for flagellar operon FliA
MDARPNIDPHAYTFVPIVQVDPDLLFDSHLSIVRRIALQVYWRFSSSIEVEDLIQIGRIALIEAARNFEDRGQAVFATYADLRVRGAMVDQLRKTAYIARSAMRRRREYRVVRNTLEGQLGRPPTDAEMAARVDMPLAQYRRTVSEDRDVHHYSLDDAYSDHNISFTDGRPDAYQNLEGKALRAALVAAMATLPTRDAMVLQLYFVEELGLEAIGQTLGVTPPRICQIKKRALSLVRAQLDDWVPS